MVVSYRLSSVTFALSLFSNHSTAIIRHPMSLSPTLKSTGVGHFGAEFGEEGVDRCLPNFNTIWDRHGAVIRKRTCFDIFCRLSTMHERNS